MPTRIIKACNTYKLIYALKSFLRRTMVTLLGTFTLRRLLTKISVYETSMHNFVRVTTIKQTRIHISRERHGILVIPAS